MIIIKNIILYFVQIRHTDDFPSTGTRLVNIIAQLMRDTINPYAFSRPVARQTTGGMNKISHGDEDIHKRQIWRWRYLTVGDSDP